MKIKVAILGYGNLGKAVEQEILKDKSLQLVAIFSSRKNIFSTYKIPILHKNEILKYTKKIDLLILCSGSQTDMLIDAPLYSKYFNTINTFDSHNEIATLYKKLNNVAIKHNKIAILSAGWDPGLFSQIRLMFSTIMQTKCTCFWGKGTSLGHSQAVKNISGVKDAISFTIPNTLARFAVINNKPVSTYLHKRKVYVVSENKLQNQQIKKNISNIPHYFKGQNVKIKFVNQQKLNKLKSLKHKGEIWCKNPQHSLKLQVKMNSNPIFTAKIILCYARAIRKIEKKYKRGAYTPLHFSPLDLCMQRELTCIKNFC